MGTQLLSRSARIFCEILREHKSKNFFITTYSQHYKVLLAPRYHRSSYKSHKQQSFKRALDRTAETYHYVFSMQAKCRQVTQRELLIELSNQRNRHVVQQRSAEKNGRGSTFQCDQLLTGNQISMFLCFHTEAILMLLLWLEKSEMGNDYNNVNTTERNVCHGYMTQKKKKENDVSV